MFIVGQDGLLIVGHFVRTSDDSMPLNNNNNSA